MKRVTKAVFGALAVAGSAMALSAPASAQSVYFGADSNGGVYGGYDSGGEDMGGDFDSGGGDDSGF